MFWPLGMSKVFEENERKKKIEAAKAQIEGLMEKRNELDLRVIDKMAELRDLRRS